MCGIAGKFQLNGHALNRDETKPVLKEMVRALVHRGPDEAGFFLHGPCALGHARLSIIDLSTGSQPMDNEDGRIWVLFNGEIFNYIELRQWLEQRGHRFKTTSDTEVLVHLYEELGPELVHRLNGQFAFAIFDKENRSLFLARDHFGICPLYITRLGDTLFFASEVKALSKIPGIDIQLDIKGIVQVFTFWSIVSPRTQFKGISCLPPGSCIYLRPGQCSALPIRRYWHLEFPRQGEEEREKTIDEWASSVRERLVEAVRLRLRADVPVGVYLSGGLDSSIISTVVKRLTDTPIEAYSVSFAQASYDESSYQKSLAQAIGVRYNSVKVENYQIGQIFPRVIWHGERPILRTAPAPLLMLSGLVRSKGFKVVLTGEGADELFAGYDIFKEDKIRRFWAKNPDSHLRPLLLGRLYPFSPHTSSRALKMLQAFYKKNLLPTDVFAYSHRPTWENTRPILAYLSREIQQEIKDYDPVEELKAQVPDEYWHWHPLHRAQFLETRLLLSEYLLCSQGERMTMANSVEGRYPFLDPALARLASRIPPEMKLCVLKEKFILREAFSDILPKEMAQRPKRPYIAPNKESFLDRPEVSRIYEILSEQRIKSAGLLDCSRVKKLLAKCQRSSYQMGFRDNAACVGVLSTQILWELFQGVGPDALGVTGIKPISS